MGGLKRKVLRIPPLKGVIGLLKDPRKEMRKTSGLGPPAMVNPIRFSISSYGTRDVSPESPSVL